jgi:hypothetical protein
MNLHDLHLIGIELGSCPMGVMLVAIFVIAKEMILTHGECERSSIVLGVLVGVDGSKKQNRSSQNFLKKLRTF